MSTGLISQKAEIDPNDRNKIEDDSNEECVILTKQIFNSEVEVEYYSCDSCPKFGSKICQSCKINCHNHEHKKISELLNEGCSKGKVKQMRCSCHENGHRKEVKESGPNTTNKQSGGRKCLFEDVAKELGFEVMACKKESSIKESKNRFCYGCYIHQSKEIKELYEIRKIPSNNEKICNCKCYEELGGEKTKREKVIEIMNSIIENYKNEKYVNIKTFFHLILFSKPVAKTIKDPVSLFDYFIAPIRNLIYGLISYNSPSGEFLNKYSFIENNSIQDPMEFFKSEFVLVKKILKMFKKLIKIYKNDTYMFIPTPNEDDFSNDSRNKNDLFQALASNFPDFNLNKLRDARMNLKPEKGRTSEADIKNINKFVYYILYFLRKIFFDKVLDSKRLFDCRNTVENLTPFHRCFQKLTSRLVSKNLNQFGKLDSSIIYFNNVLYGNNNLILGNNKASFQLVNEYFKWCINIASIQDNLDKHKKYSKGKIEDKFYDDFAGTFIKDKLPDFKEFLQYIKDLNSDNEENKLKLQIRKLNKTIQEFVMAYIITTNDYAFIKFFNSKRWDKDKEWEDNFENDLYNLGEHDYGHFYKLSKLYLQSHNEDKYKEMMQMYSRNRSIFYFTKGKFEDFFLEIFYLLFSTNISDIKIDKAIYNSLLVEDDLYIRSIKNYFNSDEKYDLPVFSELSIMSKDCSDHKNLDIDQDIQSKSDDLYDDLEQIYKAIKVYKENKMQYYNGQRQNKIFNIEESFLQIFEQYSTQFLNKDVKNRFENSDLLQSKAVKIGLFDILLDFYHMLNTDAFVIHSYNETHKEEPNYIKHLQRTILRIFKLYFNNAFLLPFFLTKSTLLILSKEPNADIEKFKRENIDGNLLSSTNNKNNNDGSRNKNSADKPQSTEEIYDDFNEDEVDPNSSIPAPIDKNNSFYGNSDYDYDQDYNIKNYFSMEQIEFYIFFINQTKLKNAKYDYTNLVKVCLNINLEYDPVYENISHEFMRDDENEADITTEDLYYEYVIQMIKLLKLCLKNNISDTINKINLLIWKYLKHQNFIKFFNSDEFDEFSNSKKKVMLEILKLINNFNDYYYLTIFKDGEFMKNIFTIMQKEKIIFKNIKITDNPTKDEILKIRLLAEEKRTLSYTYTKYYIISPYIIKKDLSLLYQQDSSKQNKKEDKILKSILAIRDRIDFEKDKDEAKNLNDQDLDKDKQVNSSVKDVKNSDKSSINNLEKTLGPLYENFRFYRINLRKIINTCDDKEIFKNFKQTILIPSIYIIYRLLYFSNEMTADIKYLTYKTVNLFIRCYNEFVEAIIGQINMVTDIEEAQKISNVRSTINRSSKKIFGIKNRLTTFIEQNEAKEYNEKMIKDLTESISSFFIFDDNCLDYRLFLQNLSDCLENDLNDITNNPLNVNFLLKKFTKYLTKIKASSFLNTKNLSDEDKEEIFVQLQENKNIKKVDKVEKIVKENDKKFRALLEEFYKLYETLKSDENINILLDFLFNKNGSEHEFYNGMLEDIFKKCLGLYDQPFKYKQIDKHKMIKIHKTPYYQFNYYGYFEAFNKIMKSNPQSVQDYFLTKTSKAYYEGKIIEAIDALINNMVTQLKFLYQFIFIDFHKLTDTNNLIFNDKESANIGFINIVEFLRLLCENHNQRFQNKLCRDIYIIDEDMTLFEFLIEFCTLVQEHYENYLKHESMCKYFKNNDYKFFEPLIGECTEFLIESIQGSKTAELFEKNNRFVKRYLDKASIALEAPKKIENICFLEQFLHFIVCLLEENAAEKEKKQEIMQGMIANKIVDILVLSTKRLLKNLKKLILYIDYPFFLKQDDDDFEKFDEFIDKNERIKERQKAATEAFNKRKEGDELDFSPDLIYYYQKSGKWFVNNDNILPLENYINKINGKDENEEEDGRENKEVATQNFNKKYKTNVDYSEKLFKLYLEYSGYFECNSFFIVAKYAIKYLYLGKLLEIKKIETIIEDNFKQFEGGQSNDEFKTLDEHGKWKVYSFAFFKRIMKEVQITEKFHYIGMKENEKDEEKEDTITNIFFVDSDVLRLNELDFESFKETAPYEDKNEKLTELLKYLPILEVKMILNKKIDNENSTLKFFNKLNNLKLNNIYISVTFALIVNFLSLMFNSYIAVGPSTNPFEQLILVERCQNAIFYINLLHLIFLLFVFIIWFYFRIYKLKNAMSLKGGWCLFMPEEKPEKDQGDEDEENPDSDKIAIYEVFKSFMDKNFYLALNFICGSIALIFPSCHFMYSIQLFIIFELFETMGTIIRSVKMRWQQFCAAGFLIIICALFFAAVKFYFYCDDPEDDACNRFLFAFLSMVSSGVRAGNGLGLEQKSINEKGYLSEFLIEWIFYFVVILVLLNIINGIIVDTFQEQREQLNDRNDSKENICYICNTNRSYFEKHGIDYDNHISSEHSLINYFQYMLTIKRSDPQNLNSLDSSIREKINNNQTDFFPQEKKDKDDKDEGDGEGS